MIAYTDRLIDNAMLCTDGSRLRAIVQCVATVQAARFWGEPHQLEVFGGLSMLDGVLALLTSRLADESSRVAMDRPIPYALTERAGVPGRWS